MALQLPGEGLRGEGAGGHHHQALGQLLHLAVPHRQPGRPVERLRHTAGKAHPVHGQGLPCGDTRPVGFTEDERAQRPQLSVQHADGTVPGVGAKGVAAHELRQRVTVVGRGATDGLHLPQQDAHATPRELVGALASGEAAADDGDRTHSLHCSCNARRAEVQRGAQALWPEARADFTEARRRGFRRPGWAGAAPAPRRRGC